MDLLTLCWMYPPYATGGTEIATAELVRSLCHQGHRVAVVTSGPSSHVRLESGSCCVVHRVREGRHRCTTYLRLMVTAVRVCRHRRFDAVHSQALWMGPIALAIRLVCGVPYVLWGRGEDIRRPRIFGGPVRYLCLRFAASVVALNCSMAVDMVRHGARKANVLGNGVSMEHAESFSRVQARRQLGMDDRVRMVLFVGRLVREKGVDVLLEAFVSIAVSDPLAELTFVGTGPSESRLREKALNMDLGTRVHFAGNVPHPRVSAYLAAADLFALPSYAEGFPMALAEAMAAGLPVVCTPVGSINEVVVNGVNGLVVPCGDADRLGAAISTLLGDAPLSAHMGRHNRLWARGQGWERIAAAFAGIVGQVRSEQAMRTGQSRPQIRSTVVRSGSCCATEHVADCLSPVNARVEVDSDDHRMCGA